MTLLEIRWIVLGVVLSALLVDVICKMIADNAQQKINYREYDSAEEFVSLATWRDTNDSISRVAYPIWTWGCCVWIILFLANIL